MARTPSPRVVAAKFILYKLAMDLPTEEMSAELTSIADSRVSKTKTEKVSDQVSKITKKLQERCEKIIDKFENPPPSKKSVAPPKKKNDV